MRKMVSSIRAIFILIGLIKKAIVRDCKKWMRKNIHFNDDDSFVVINGKVTFLCVTLFMLGGLALCEIIPNFIGNLAQYFLG